MQNIRSLVKSGVLALLITSSLVMTASAACRTETKFNEFTRTWSTNNVCDFGTAPVNNSWAFTNLLTYAPAYVAPVAPVVSVPSFTWSPSSWFLGSVPTYVAPTYSLSVTPTITSSAPAPAVYQDSGVVVDQYWNGSSWTNDWSSATWVDRFTDSCGDFFEAW